MELFLQVGRLHGLFPGLHFVRISPDGIDLPVVDDEPVGVRPLPAGVGVGAKPGMDGGNGRFIVRILKISEEGAKLSHQKHTLIHNGPAGKGYHISVIRGLLEYPPCDIQSAVKGKSLRCICGLLYKALHNVGHTLHRFMSKYIGKGGHFTPAQKLHAFLLYNNLKHLLCLIAAKLLLGEEKHANAVFPFPAQVNSQRFGHLHKKFVGYLGQNANAVSRLSFRILTGSVL